MISFSRFALSLLLVIFACRADALAQQRQLTPEQRYRLHSGDQLTVHFRFRRSSTSR